MQPALFEDVSMPAVRFSAVGVPQPQGSKVGQIVGRRVRYRGAHAIVDPKVLLTEQADMSTKTMGRDRLKKWRGQVASAAMKAMLELKVATPTWRAVVLSAEFVLARPQSHYTSKGDLTLSARRDHPHPGKPDLSKLIRAVEDALSGIVYGDDSQVQRYGDVFKRYADRGGRGGVIVEVKCL